jgi:uncharacterized protein (TIGR03435 family)
MLKHFIVVLPLAIPMCCQGQTPANSDAKPKTYEVVSIKPSQPEARGGSMAGLPDGFRDINVRFATLVQGAYDVVTEDQVTGLPSWAKSDKYDVEAKVDPSTANEWSKLSNKERWKQEQILMQALLADRCKLKVHFETKNMPVYELVVAKGGLKLKDAAPDEKPMEAVNGDSAIVRAMSIEALVYMFSGRDGRLIVDKTGLGDKKFDFELKWSDNNSDSVESAPSLFTALEEQLGLKLVSSKAPGKVLVIDHMEKPSPN